MVRKRFIQAINEALFEEMTRDPKVILIGEDVEASIFGDTRGLHAAFGPDRVRNTPISEATLTGMAVGAAASGYRIVLHMMFANFIYTGFDAIANQMAKMRLMTGGQVSLPITVIASYGGRGSTAAPRARSPRCLPPSLLPCGPVVRSPPPRALQLHPKPLLRDPQDFYHGLLEDRYAALGGEEFERPHAGAGIAALAERR